MTCITWKERQTNGSQFEKTLSLKSEKYRSAKRGYLSKYYDIVMGPGQKLSDHWRSSLRSFLM